jgi:hypothetical protein
MSGGAFLAGRNATIGHSFLSVSNRRYSLPKGSYLAPLTVSCANLPISGQRRRGHA